MAKNRTNGEGSLYRLPNGKWRAEINLIELGKRKRRTKNCDKKADAIAWMRKTRQEIDSGVGVESHNTTVGRYLTQWLEDEIRPERSENTYISYEGIIRLYLIPHLGRFTMQSIRPAHIQAMLAELERLKVGARTRELCYVVLHACFARAVRWRDLAHNPCSAVQRPRKPQRTEMQPFSAEEARKVLKYAKQTDWHAMIALALSTGMRQGELFGLSPDDIDRQAKTISVRRQAIEPKGIPHLADLKTRRSRRTLDVTDTTMDAIVDHLASRLKRGLTGAETLFCSDAGTIMSKTNFRRRVWLPLFKKAKLEPRGFHQTRHTYATLSLLAGVPVTVVSAVMGHAQPSITLNVYSHVLEGSQQLSTDAMSELLG